MSTEPSTPIIATDEAISMRGIPSLSDYGCAYVLHLWVSMRPLIRVLAIVLLVFFNAAAIVYMWLWYVGAEPAWASVFIVGGVICADFSAFGRGFLHGRRARRCMQGIVWQVNGKGITIEQPDAQSKLLWSAFVRLILSRKLALLYLQSTGQYYLLSSRMFASDSDWQIFRRLAATQVGVCRRCRYSLRGTRGDTCPECGERIPGNRALITRETAAE